MGEEPTQCEEELKLYGHESYEDVTEEFMNNAKREFVKEQVEMLYILIV